MPFPIRVRFHLGWYKHELVRENRHITRSMIDSSRGWLFECECGKVWAL